MQCEVDEVRGTSLILMPPRSRITGTFIFRDCVKTNWQSLINLNKTIHNEVDVEIIEAKFNDLKLQWDEVQSKHDNYLFVLYPDQEEPFEEQKEQWIRELDEKFEIMQKTKCDCSRGIKEGDVESKHTQINEDLRKGKKVESYRKHCL